MISAWGVDHGEVSKAFRKLGPKLVRANARLQEGNPVARTQSMEGRIQENYAQWRHAAGKTGSRSKEDRLGDKEGAAGMVTAAQNRSRRKGRKLP